MVRKELKVRVQLKTDISTKWAEVPDFVPLKGEVCFYTDLKNFKVGDGSTKISLLDFVNEDAKMVTQSEAGLMSSADKTKLDGIATGANKYVLPTASSTTLGGVKSGSSVTSTSGLTACPIIGGVPYYGGGIVAKYTTIGGTAEFPVSISKFYFFEIYNISSNQYSRKAFVGWFTFENGQIKNSIGGNLCSAFYNSTTGKVIVGMGEQNSGQYLVIQYPLGQGDITCIVENTPILIKDRTTNELTTKLVQDIKVGDELAFWSPIAGGLSYNKVIMPVVVGDCTAYNKVCFSDGSYVNVYGNQLFWDVDQDAMISYKEMTTENRVCKQDGTIVHFDHIEGMVSDAILKHYTIMTQYGKFIANGVQTGDKVELFYPRFQRDENLSYWMKLTDKQRQFYIDKYNDGLTRRNWFTSELYRETLYPLFKEKREQNKLLEEKQAYLDSTDYQVVKKMEGLLTDDEFAPVKVARQEARDAINAARDRIAELDTIIKEKEAEVKATIYGKRKYTYHNAFEGKTRAVLDDAEPSAD